MSFTEFKIGGKTLTVPQHFKTAIKRKAMPQREKVALLATVIMTCLYRNGNCTIDDLEMQVADRISGRLNVTIGKGVGGKGGMNLLRGSDGSITLCRDNVTNLLHILGDDGRNKWAESIPVAVEELQSWLDSLPKVDG
jgi:hypothetical protein